jgi:NAD(P)-dependent dehydrogenase (short-subunit alcohol dehydrogenase family)
MTDKPRRALVTGATQGIGLAVARRLAAEGHSVVAVYQSDDASSEAAVGELDDGRLGVRLERVDLRLPEEALALFRRLADEDRSPELLINAHGLTLATPVALRARPGIDEAPDPSLRTQTTFLACRQAVQTMGGQGFGRIINFLFPASLLSHEAQTAFEAANSSVLGFTRALAREVGPLGITVNVVSPGLIRTESDDRRQDEELEVLRRRTPLQRSGTAAEVAGLVSMLCEEDAGYITGQCLSIDGGLS